MKVTEDTSKAGDRNTHSVPGQVSLGLGERRSNGEARVLRHMEGPTQSGMVHLERWSRQARAWVSAVRCAATSKGSAPAPAKQRPVLICGPENPNPFMYVMSLPDYVSLPGNIRNSTASHTHTIHSCFVHLEARRSQKSIKNTSANDAPASPSWRPAATRWRRRCAD